MTTVTKKEAASIKEGRVLVHDTSLYVAVTPLRQHLDEIKQDASRCELQGLQTQHLTTAPKTHYVGVLPVERLERLDLLRLSDGKVSVRFRGDYRTQRFSISDFETENRRIIRSHDGKAVGLYHVNEQSFLQHPDRDQSGAYGSSLIRLDGSEPDLSDGPSLREILTRTPRNLFKRIRDYFPIETIS